MQLRAEFYNAFNHTQFSAFDTAVRCAESADQHAVGGDDGGAGTAADSTGAAVYFLSSYWLAGRTAHLVSLSSDDGSKKVILSIERDRWAFWMVGSLGGVYGGGVGLFLSARSSPPAFSLSTAKQGL